MTRAWIQAGLVFALAMVASSRALALCPNCLGQDPGLSPTLGLVGVFLLVPLAVFFVVARVIRRLERAAQGSSDGSDGVAPTGFSS